MNGEPMKGSIWHYTIGTRMKMILRDRLIKLATANVPAGERPVVWFSTNPAWEETANKGIMTEAGNRVGLTKQETAERGKGLYRIAVSSDTASFNIYEFRKRSGVSSKMWKGLFLRAEQCGSVPTEWRVSFDPVPSEKWLSVECWDRDIWRPLFETEIENLAAKVEVTVT